MEADPVRPFRSVPRRHAGARRIGPFLPLLLLIGLLTGPGAARAQTAAPRPGAPQAANADPPRYRFLERYSPRPGRGATGVIGQYQAAFRETITVHPGGPAGRPAAPPTVRQAIYQERPAAVDRNDGRRVVALLRRYRTVRITAGPSPRTAIGGQSLEGVTLRCVPRAAGPPAIEILTPGHTLGDQESLLARSQIFAPDLALVLPEQPVPVGDSWVIPNAATATLLGRRLRRGLLAGRLTEVRDAPDHQRRVALIEIEGEVLADIGITTVQARLQFAFDPAALPRAGAVVDAPGAITFLALRQRSRLADRQNVRADIVDRALTLERRLDDPGDELPLP